MTAEDQVAGMRDRLTRRLPAGALGLPLFVHATLPSTNDAAKDLAAAGAAEGTAVIALEQTRGRGRQGRTWVSPAGKGLYLSVVLRPAWKAADAPRLAALGALAIARALETADSDRTVGVKHPNDVLVAGRKIAGVLVEPRVGGGRLDFAVLGLGLNVGQSPEDWAGAGIAQPVTSCRMEGIDWELPEAGLRVLTALDEVYRQALDRPGRDALLEEWSARSAATRAAKGMKA